MLLFTLAACSRVPTHPNILLITLDTTRVDAIGAYGAGSTSTPNIDQLSVVSARFTRAYTVTPLTIPAHSSMMTGLYPPRHGVRDNGDFFLAPEAVTLAERLRAGGYATAAAVGAEVTSHHWGFAQGFDFFADDLGKTDEQGNRWRVERSADRVTDDALGWLNAQPEGGQPWFLWTHFYDPHHPYAAPAAFREADPQHPYRAEVAFVDSEVGRIIEAIRVRGETERTWIVIVADHGEGLGAHGESMHGVLLYDATTRIPMIIRAPGEEGRVIDSPTSLVDLLPTIVSAAGLGVVDGVDGIDLGGAVRGHVDSARSVYAESLYALHHYGWAAQRALVTPDRKLIDSTTPEMYAREDALERDDLALTDPAGLAELRAKLATLAAAMEPVAGASASAADNATRTSQLEALGYMTAQATIEVTEALPDPVRRLPVLAKVERARALLQADDLAGAEGALRSIIEAEPGLGEPQMMLASVLGRLNRPDEARSVVEQLDASRPSSQAKSFLGALRMRSGDMHGAASLFGAALAIDPYLSGAWSGYLHALFMSGDPQLLAEADRGGALLPDSATVLGMRGVARATVGDFARAEGLLLRALTLDPVQPFANHALGLVRRHQADAAGAEASLLEEVRLFPPSLPSRRLLVEIYAGQKRYAEQLDQLAAIAASVTPDAETLHSMAQAQFNLKRFEDAHDTVRRCRAQAPGYPGCAMLEANVLKKLGRDVEAQRVYEDALRLSGKAPPTR